jgi:uncharacterized protein (TIGR02302 family)
MARLAGLEGRMKRKQTQLPEQLTTPLRLTRAGMLAERLARLFWPLWAVTIAAIAALMLGLHEVLPIEAVWGLAVLAVASGIGFAVRGLWRFRLPTRAEAMARLDDTLAGRPIRALQDAQAIGGEDAASVAVWRAHQARMRSRAMGARAVAPDLRLASRDPFGLRYIALMSLMVAVLFGSLLRVGTVGAMVPGQNALAAGGPVWEGWVEPPSYTGKPSLYLNDLTGALTLPEGSRIVLRLYGAVGALTVSETVSGRTEIEGSATDPAQGFSVTRSGRLEIAGQGGRGWDITMLKDGAPRISLADAPEPDGEGRMRLPFMAEDDYGVTGGMGAITLDLAAVDRRHGLAVAPEPRDDIAIDLPMPLNGARERFEETVIEDFSEHAWANLPITMNVQVRDALDQTGESGAKQMVLPGRRFFDPLAAAIIEQRRDLLWSRENAGRVAMILRTVSHRPEGFFKKDTHYLRLRMILRRIETMARHGGMSTEQRDEAAAALWDLAVALEEGDLSDALERMRQAQERLSEAMKNGANDAEIAQLMQELREATQDYMRQLAQQQGDEQQDQQSAENSMQMTQDDLQKMMDRIQELMEQGRMAEAQQALEEFQQMMENMRVTQGEGQGQQSPGEQAMEGLSETLREQQGLSDQAFRDLQEQFNPNARAGESDGNEGRNGGRGRGQAHDPQAGEGTGEGQGEGDQQGQSGQQQPGEQGQQGQGQQSQGMSESLADRQQALRQELSRQRGNLPGIGGEPGAAAGEALDRAGRAMDGAEEALRGDDLAEAIDKQAEAMEALREGMRNLGEALAQEQRQNSGQQGQATGNPGGQQRDPLGRSPGASGQAGSDENLLQGEDVYRRARDLLDEIRRRSGEGERSAPERDYLKRLLDRF